jgi:diacylglycerol kinase
MSMPVSTTNECSNPFSARHQRRPAWRRRLVELERGIAFGFRAGGVVSVHFFCGLIGLVAGSGLGLTVSEWGLLLGCFIMSLAFELAHQAVRVLCRTPGSSIDAARRAECASSAAATLSLCGGIVISLLILGERAYEVWQH